MRFLNILVLFIFSIIANSSMVLANATYKQFFISGYQDTGYYRSIDIALYDVKLTARSEPITVQFELHTSKNYQYKIYIEASDKTFQGEIPRSLTWKQNGDYYIHGNGGDPVSVSRFNSSLEKTDRLILRGICQFVKDRDNLENIFEQVINGSHGKQKKYWQKFRTRMIGDTQVAARRCLSQLGGSKVVFLKENLSSFDTVCGLHFSKAKSRSELINLQRGLLKRKLYKGNFDGEFGANSCKALKKWAACENIGQAYLSDGALSKLINTNPSSRELSCYENKNDNDYKLTYSGFELRPVDGRSEGRNIIGSWVTLKNVKLDGDMPINKNIWFEILGSFPSQRIEMIGFSSKQTFTNMPTSIGQKFGNPNLGYGFAIRPNNISGAQSRIQKLDSNDQFILKGICGLMTNENFVTDIVHNLKNQKAFGFRDYVDNDFMKFWKGGSKVREILNVAEGCNRAIGNTGLKQIAFKSAAPGIKKSNLNKAVKNRFKCQETKLAIRLNQIVLKNLGLYTSSIDGIVGPNYLQAITRAEQLLGQWADGSKGCIRESERKILEAVFVAQENGSICKNLPNALNIKSKYNELEKLGIINKNLFKRETINTWMIKKVSELEKSLSSINFYNEDKVSIRDCRLDDAELIALNSKTTIISTETIETPEVPKEPQTFSLNVGSLSVEYIEDQSKDLKEYKVRLKTMGSEIDTSVVSKSLFGFENVSSVDVILNMSNTNAYVDFVIDEENTKVKFDGSKAFVMRLKDDSSSNVTSGEFGKALGGLDIRDVAMVGAHCSKIQEITKSKDNFVKFIDRNIAISSKDGFSNSPIASDGIVKIINDHATSCVDTLFAVTKVKSAFLIETKIKENVKVQELNESLTKNTLEKSRLLKSLSAFEMKTQKDAVNVQRTAARLAQLIDELDLMRIQLGATSSTDMTLEKEVKELEIKISALKDIVPNLELKLQKIQSNIQDANAKLADKTSRETTIDRVLNEASNKAYTLQGEVERFGPQAIAGEETVKNLIIQLKNDYVPLDEFKVEDTRLKELTQVVTESSKEIQLLRKDLFDIRSIEQSYIEKCLADRQCKAVMGERLGVE